MYPVKGKTWGAGSGTLTHSKDHRVSKKRTEHKILELRYANTNITR